MTDGRGVRATELNELAAMLANLLKAAETLPNGSERQAVLNQIDRFQKRVAALIETAAGEPSNGRTRI